MNTDRALDDVQAAYLELWTAAESIDHRDASMRLAAARRRIHTELWTWRVVAVVLMMTTIFFAAM